MNEKQEEKKLLSQNQETHSRVYQKEQIFPKFTTIIDKRQERRRDKKEDDKIGRKEKIKEGRDREERERHEKELRKRRYDTRCS